MNYIKLIRLISTAAIGLTLASCGGGGGGGSEGSGNSVTNNDGANQTTNPSTGKAPNQLLGNLVFNAKSDANSFVRQHYSMSVNSFYHQIDFPYGTAHWSTSNTNMDYRKTGDNAVIKCTGNDRGWQLDALFTLTFQDSHTATGTYSSTVISANGTVYTFSYSGTFVFTNTSIL